MFWALAAGRIDTGDRRYVHELGDIESLSRRALAGELEVTAVSLHAYAYLADRYALLAHGASIGDRYGPRIVARAARPTDPRAALGAGSLRIAVPGELTTAYLARSEEHTSELQSQFHLVCRLLLEKKKKQHNTHTTQQNAKPLH